MPVTRVVVQSFPPTLPSHTHRRHIQQLINRPYKFGFKTLIESETFPKGLDEDVVSA